MRLGVALASMLMVYYYPIGDMSPLYFIAVLLVHLASSFASTMMMVSQVHLNLSLSLSALTLESDSFVHVELGLVLCSHQ